MSFAIDLEKTAKNLGSDAEAAMAKVIVIAFQGIVTKTPVDTGRARGNWNIAELKPNLATEETPAANHAEQEIAKAKAAATVALKVGGDIYISNNLPYIRRLEYGHSQQSEAMVRRTIEEIKARFA